LLSAGFWHGELATLLWGTLFGGLLLYCLAASFLVRLRVPELRLEQVLPLVDADFPSTCELKLGLRTTPPLFQWKVVALARHGDSRQEVTRFDATGTKLRALWQLPRGNYAVVARWELRDVLGLTRWRPRSAARCELLVAARNTSRTPPTPTSRSAEQAGTRRQLRREGEAFDARPYHPGDDLRRLHWPLWAHSGQTWVRIPDPAPPPSGPPVWILDLSVPAWLTAQQAELALDRRLEELSGWLAHGEWAILVPQLGLKCDKPSELKRFLAGLTAGHEAEDLPAEGPWWGRLPSEVRLVTGPGCPGGERLQRLLDVYRLVPTLVELPKLETPTGRTWWQRA
jgi:hypothetical protein